MQYPPIISVIKTCQLKGLLPPKPNKYPAIEENKTLMAKPAFVIALKSLKIDLKENVFIVASNEVAFAFLIWAKILIRL